MENSALLVWPTEPAIAGTDVLTLIADSVICTDKLGRILFFNRAAEQAFGYSANEVVGQHVEVLLPGRHRAQHADQVRGFALGDGAASRLMGHRREVIGQRKNGEEFPAEATVSRQTVNGKTVLAVAVRDITERKALEEQRDAIAREMEHRVKNLMSVVYSIVSLAAASATNVADFKVSLLERLAALGRTQCALRFGAMQSTSLSELLLAELAHYRVADAGNIVIKAPPVLLGPKAAQTLALAFHELATNSAKYGALSRVSGRVEVTSAYVGERNSQIAIEWCETGGPLVKPPSRQGFGTTLIKQVIERSFRAQVILDYLPGGLRCKMTLPKAIVDAAHQR